MVQKIKTFLSETRVEWRHINWPTRSEAMYLTGVVIGLSVVLGVFLGAFDYLFLTIVRMLVAM